METAGFLQIQFDFYRSVKIFWRGNNQKLGTVDEEESIIIYIITMKFDFYLLVN